MSNDAGICRRTAWLTCWRRAPNPVPAKAAPWPAEAEGIPLAELLDRLNARLAQETTRDPERAP
ncbi:hypothetical protein ACEYYA_06895 [Paracoccus sp. p3-h83]|uniref:hypothetical protein n=1 Tax=Paracoccus sp. p3-h83 TaxID=3342805 RepID=UPI0035BAA6BD